MDHKILFFIFSISLYVNCLAQQSKTYLVPYFYKQLTDTSQIYTQCFNKNGKSISYTNEAQDKKFDEICAFCQDLSPKGKVDAKYIPNGNGYWTYISLNKKGQIDEVGNLKTDFNNIISTDTIYIADEFGDPSIQVITNYYWLEKVGNWILFDGNCRKENIKIVNKSDE